MADHVIISPSESPYSVSGPSSTDGFTYTERGPVDHTVYRLTGDKQFAPKDGSVVLVDTDSAGSDVSLTVDSIPAGAQFKIINENGSNQVDIAGASGVNLTTNEAGTSIPASDGAVARATHTVNGEIYLDGDLEANT